MGHNTGIGWGSRMEYTRRHFAGLLQAGIVVAATCSPREIWQPTSRTAQACSIKAFSLPWLATFSTHPQPTVRLNYPDALEDITRPAKKPHRIKLECSLLRFPPWRGATGRNLPHVRCRNPLRSSYRAGTAGSLPGISRAFCLTCRRRNSRG